MTDKTARELLEEAATMIVTPIAKVGDLVVTGWLQGEEFEGLQYDREYVEVLNPSQVTVGSDYVSMKGVCAIGAISLASLTQTGLNFTGTYSDWSTQALINREVALATVVLAKTIWDEMVKTTRTSPTMWTAERVVNFMNDRAAYVEHYSEQIKEPLGRWTPENDKARFKLADLFIRGSYKDLLALSHEELAFMANSVVNYITLYNDDESHTYTDVADMFAAAVKNLIKAEESA